MIGHIYWVFGGRPLVPHSYLAVDFFFLLSGFVVAHAYGARLRSRKLGYWRYGLHRAVRLYPLIVLGALVGFGYALAAHTPDATAALLPALFAVPVLDGAGSTSPLNGPAWSLFFEIFASLAFGALAIRAPRAVGWVAAGAGILFLGYSLLSREGNLGVDVTRFWWGFPRVAFGFCAGALLCRASGRILCRLPALPFWALAGVLTATLLVPRRPDWIAYDMAVIFVLYPLLILLGARCGSERLSQVWLMERSGDLSYPLYILHWPLFQWAALTYAAAGLSYRSHGVLYGGLAAVGAIVISLVAFHYDTRLRAHLRTRLGLDRTSPTSPRVGDEHPLQPTTVHVGEPDVPAGGVVLSDHR
jgi:peptidoglycan/LPS O-acetylase OafA/YrhL